MMNLKGEVVVGVVGGSDYVKAKEQIGETCEEASAWPVSCEPPILSLTPVS